LWEVESGKEIRRFDGHTDTVRLLEAVWPHGRRFVSFGDEKVVRLWDLVNGKELSKFSIRRKKKDVWVKAFSRNGQVALSSGFENTVRLWEINGGREAGFNGGCHVYGGDISPDGRFALTGGSDKTVRFWDLRMRKALRTLRGHTDHVYRVVLSPDGGQALSWARDKTMRLWDLTTGRQLLVQRDVHLSGNIVFSPDGRRAAYACKDGTVRVLGLPD
jgi:WD40 repeat protein